MSWNVSTLMSNMRIAAMAMVFGALCAQAHAADQYPVRPIHMVVGFPAGGASDVAARAIAEKMSVELGQPIVIENKPGAASNIASDAVAKAGRGGDTVLFGTISLAINQSLYKKLNYDASRDLAPVAQLSSAPFMLVANINSPYKTVADVVSAAGKVAGKDPIHFASAGNGSGSHLFMELFMSKAGVKLSHVPYRGAAPAMVDVLGGLVPLTFDNIITTLPLIEAGKLRPLAVSSSRRSPAAPSIPTVAESGVPGYDASSWFGLFAPAGTPAAVIDRLNRAATNAVKTESVSATLRAGGAEPVGSSAAEFSSFFRSEVEKWAAVVNRANVQID